jgi:hypothetical protein
MGTLQQTFVDYNTLVEWQLYWKILTMSITTSTVTKTSQVLLNPDHVGINGDADVSTQSIEEAKQQLQKNHDTYHMFFRDKAGHNHIAHSLLTQLALGATPEDLQRAYDDGTDIQRPIPKVNEKLVEELTDDEKLYEKLETITEYTTFLEFFQQQIDKDGYKDVVNKYLFSRTKLAETLLARMYEGAYHPIIHLGLGIEFDSPTIVAEALAQAAAHDDSNISQLFINCEEAAAIAYPPKNPKPLIQLINETRDSDTIRNAPKWEDFGNKMKNGIIGRALTEMTSIACQFRIKPDDLQRRTAEMISTCAFFAGASQQPGRKCKIDFFYMHNVTSSIFFSVFIKQDWISMEDRTRLVEWKGRLDLAWYAVSGCAELHKDAVENYQGDFGADMGWKDLYATINKEHDDGHVAKFVRALKNGEQASKPFEQDFSDFFPTKGDMWLKTARMALDTTKDLPTDLKWVPFTGFKQAWDRPDLLPN